MIILVMLLSVTGKDTFSPGKWHQQVRVGLGLDLSSGTQVELQAETGNGKAPPAGETSRLDLRAYGHVLQLLTELEGFGASRDEVVGALERCEVRLSSAGEAGRVAIGCLSRRPRPSTACTSGSAAPRCRREL